MKRKLKLVFLIFIGLLAISIIFIENPILLKYISGTARIIGKPVESKIYVDGRFNKLLKLYHVNSYWQGNKADYYLLDFGKLDTSKWYRVISVNIQDQYVGLPSSTDIKNYDVVFRYLFQGEVGAYFTPINNKVKGLGFQPNLKITKKKISFNLPKEQFKIDSIRIEF